MHAGAASQHTLGRAEAAADILHRGAISGSAGSDSEQRSSNGRDAGRGRPRQSRGPRINVEAESRRLADEAAAAANNPRGAGMREVRRKLPAFAQRQDVMTRLRAGRVLVVSGATGEEPWHFV